MKKQRKDERFVLTQDLLEHYLIDHYPLEETIGPLAKDYPFKVRIPFMKNYCPSSDSREVSDNSSHCIIIGDEPEGVYRRAAIDLFNGYYSRMYFTKLIEHQML